MISGLFQALGLEELTAVLDKSDEGKQFRAQFDEALASVNEALRTASSAAPAGVLSDVSAQRDKLIAAYQKVSKQLESQGSASGEETGRVLKAAQALGNRSEGLAQEAENQRKQWEAREEQFDEVATQAAELSDADHPKGAALGKLVEAIRVKVSDRSFTEASSALDQLGPKITALYSAHTEQQGSAEEDSQPAARVDDAPRTVEGAGGYAYEQHADGKLFIVKAPNRGDTRTEVKPGGKAYEAIQKEIGPHPATLTPTPAGAPPTEPPSGPPADEGLLEGILGGISEAIEGVADGVKDAVESIGEALGLGGDGAGQQAGEAAPLPADQTPPEPIQVEVPEILGGAETEVEKKLAEFTKAMENIEVEVDGETVSVRPPYHWNKEGSSIRTDAEQARKDNPKVNAVLKRVFKGDFGTGAKVGKATPEQMQAFLQESIKAGLIEDTSAAGMKEYLDKYGVSTDCSGLMVQALNFLEDGNMSKESTDEIKSKDYVNTTKIAKFDYKVGDPKKLRAGDAMVKGGKHVRLITDVDLVGESVEFTTLESTTDTVSEHGKGVGQRRWRFPDASDPQRLELESGGAFKPTTLGKGYIYTRHDSLVEKSATEENQPEQQSAPQQAGEKAAQGAVAGAAGSKADSSPRTVNGSGGYAYEQHADGKLFIVGTPQGSGRAEVKPGSKAYEAIQKEIGPHPATLQTADRAAPAEPPTGPPADPSLFEEVLAGAEGLLDGIKEAAGGIADKIGDALGFGEEEEQPVSADPVPQGPPTAPPQTEEGGESAEGDDTYRDQRDNPKLGGGTCNVTTLAMQLLSLAGGDESMLRNKAVELLKAKGKQASTDTQLEELLRQLTIVANKNSDTVTLGNGKKYKAWEVAYVLDAVSEMFKSLVKKTETVEKVETKARYEEVIQPVLDAGGVVMLSNKLTSSGHIIKLESMLDDGILVDDPFGCLVEATGKYLKNGEPLDKYSINRIKNQSEVLGERLKHNAKLKKELESLAEKGEGKLPGNAGNNNFYSWDDVKKYRIGKWVNLTHKQ